MFMGDGIIEIRFYNNIRFREDYSQLKRFIIDHLVISPNINISRSLTAKGLQFIRLFNLSLTCEHILCS